MQKHHFLSLGVKSPIFPHFLYPSPLPWHGDSKIQRFMLTCRFRCLYDDENNLGCAVCWSHFVQLPNPCQLPTFATLMRKISIYTMDYECLNQCSRWSSTSRTWYSGSTMLEVNARRGASGFTFLTAFMRSVSSSLSLSSIMSPCDCGSLYIKMVMDCDQYTYVITVVINSNL